LNSLPLIAGFAEGAVFARRGRVAIGAAAFLADCARLAALLPERSQVLNLCADRYRFAVGFAAALLRGQVSLLPPNHTPDLVAQLSHQYPQLYCLTDTVDEAVRLETVMYPSDAAAPAAPPAVPSIPADRLTAIVFTSGSTGTPVPNPKSWRMLVQSARGEIERLGTAAWPRMSLLATVPPQHMYGLESTVLMPMLGGLALGAGRPFYAADIAAELELLPRPRGLVTTPVHLRAVLAMPGALPPVDFMLCATAPLPRDLAVEAETRFGAPLYEIYGCTEAGQVASRRTSAGQEWRALPGIVLRSDESGTWVAGGHVQGNILLNDVIELSGPETFHLLGRTADLVNIAGKRTSLAHLNYQLNAIEGVADGVFLMPDSEGDLARLTALAVAPGLTSAALTQALRQRIDAAFMPRPLYLVDALPRNSTGKLTRQALAELLARLAAKAQ
jgi:acyl-coenzyme A synthetase/AMP-(fatty) acid ligase